MHNFFWFLEGKNHVLSVFSVIPLPPTLTIFTSAIVCRTRKPNKTQPIPQNKTMKPPSYTKTKPKTVALSIPQTTVVFGTAESCILLLFVGLVLFFFTRGSVLIFSTSFDCSSYGKIPNTFWWFDYVKLDIKQMEIYPWKYLKYLQNLAIIFRNQFSEMYLWFAFIR